MAVHSTTTLPGGRRRVHYGAAAALAAVAAVVALAITTGTGPKPQPATPAPSRQVGISLMALTPARLAGNALGTGYQLPTKPSGPTLQSVLASMSPQTRSYTEKVMALTFAQLAAGAAGSP